MAKGDKFYIENFVQSTEFSVRAANYLVDCLANYDPEKIENALNCLHTPDVLILFPHLAHQNRGLHNEGTP